MKVLFLGEKMLYKLQIYWISFNSQAFPKRESLYLDALLNVEIFAQFRKKMNATLEEYERFLLRRASLNLVLRKFLF